MTKASGFDGLTYDLDADRYEIGASLGSGSYGMVVGAYDRIKKCPIAIKQVPRLFDHLQMTKKVIREICILNYLKGNDKIISLVDVELLEDSLYILTDVCKTDLKKIIQTERKYRTLKPANRLYIMYQILSAIDFLHSLDIIHRDIKPANVLVNADYSVKLCDFGLARVLDVQHDEMGGQLPKDDLTEYVVTRWYRAPEVVVNPGRYGKGQDVWAAACTFAEMIRPSPLFPGTSVIDQLHVIVDILGRPTNMDLDFDISDRSRRYMNGLQSKEIGLEEALVGSYNTHPDLFNVLRKMLIFNPKHRITACTALQSPLFLETRRTIEFSFPELSYKPDHRLDISYIDKCEISSKSYRKLIEKEIHDIQIQCRCTSIPKLEHSISPDSIMDDISINQDTISSSINNHYNNDQNIIEHDIISQDYQDSLDIYDDNNDNDNDDIYTLEPINESNCIPFPSIPTSAIPRANNEKSHIYNNINNHIISHNRDKISDSTSSTSTSMQSDKFNCKPSRINSIVIHSGGGGFDNSNSNYEYKSDNDSSYTSNVSLPLTVIDIVSRASSCDQTDSYQQQHQHQLISKSSLNINRHQRVHIATSSSTNTSSNSTVINTLNHNNEDDNNINSNNNNSNSNSNNIPLISVQEKLKIHPFRKLSTAIRGIVNSAVIISPRKLTQQQQQQQASFRSPKGELQQQQRVVMIQGVQALQIVQNQSQVMSSSSSNHHSIKNKGSSVMPISQPTTTTPYISRNNNTNNNSNVNINGTTASSTTTTGGVRPGNLKTNNTTSNNTNGTVNGNGASLSPIRDSVDNINNISGSSHRRALIKSSLSYEKQQSQQQSQRNIQISPDRHTSSTYSNTLSENRSRSQMSPNRRGGGGGGGGGIGCLQSLSERRGQSQLHVSTVTTSNTTTSSSTSSSERRSQSSILLSRMNMNGSSASGSGSTRSISNGSSGNGRCLDPIIQSQSSSTSNSNNNNNNIIPSPSSTAIAMASSSKETTSSTNINSQRELMVRAQSLHTSIQSNKIGGGTGTIGGTISTSTTSTTAVKPLRSVLINQNNPYTSSSSLSSSRNAGNVWT